MTSVREIEVPPDSLLASFGSEVEAFYTSLVFRPERVILRLIGSPATREDARKLAQGETDRFGVWKVVERQPAQILLDSKPTGTASWFAVEPTGQGTRLLFGSWVGNLDQSGWRSLERAHKWYSEVLLRSVELA